MLPKERYLKTVRRNYRPFYWWLFYKGASMYEHYEAFLDEPFAIRNQVISDNVTYYDKEEVARCSELTYRTWIQPERLRQARAEFDRRAAALEYAATHGSFDEFCTALEVYMPSVTKVFIVDDRVNREIRQALEAKIGPEETEELLHILNIPLEDNFYKQEEYDLVTTDNLAEHVKRYEWIRARYGDDRPTPR